MRFSLFVWLCLFTGQAVAWSGIKLELSETDNLWEFKSGDRETRISYINLQVEDKATTELRVGADFGYMTLRVDAPDPADIDKFDAQYIGIYLRQPFVISQSISLHGMLSYRYHSGTNNIDPIDIDWSEVALQLAASFRISNIDIAPFAVMYHVDGDISEPGSTEVFEGSSESSHGIRFDYYVDPTAFVRLEFRAGEKEGGYLGFARRF